MEEIRGGGGHFTIHMSQSGAVIYIYSGQNINVLSTLPGNKMIW
jgi:hypothetical protein